MFKDLTKLICNRTLLAKIIFASSVVLCPVQNALADLQITKTIDPISPSPAADNDFIRYNLSVTNTGPGQLTNVVIDDTPDNLDNVSFTVTSANPPPNSSGPGPNRYTFNNLAAGETVTLNVNTNVDASDTCPVINNSANVSSGAFSDSSSAPSIEFDFELTSGTSSNVITHVAATSFCEFCDTGEVHIRITNPTTSVMQNIVLQEDLQALGLTYINNSTTSTVGGASNPTITSGGTVLTWTSAQIGALANLAAGASVEIAFDVSTYTEASILADASRDIIANVTFDMPCITGTQTVNSGQFELPIDQAEPRVIKRGRNFDAGQTGYANNVYGNRNDDVIWRVNVRNQGDANLEALRINDSISGNFSINFICPSNGTADAVAANNGALPGGSTCISMTTPFDVDDPFGNAGDPDDVTANSTDAHIYYVGRVLNTHTNETNTADVSWGCEAGSPAGGLITVPASTNGSTPSVTLSNGADLRTTVTPANLQITQTVTGSNPARPLGTKGLMTIELNNQSGGSIQDITMDVTLPSGYVMDNTYGVVNGVGSGQATTTRTAAYGNNYPGFIDTFTRDDAELLTADPLDDLNPTFTFTSSTLGADPVEQVNMLRRGDRVTITFGIIMIEAIRFDYVADLDLDEEFIGDGTDPTNALALSNNVTVDFDAVDPTGLQAQTRVVPFNYNSDPEDLDISISDSLFILTNDVNVPLDLNVLLDNNGGHDADDYTVYVSFGQAMTVQTPAANCVATSNPPPHPHWNDPSVIPATAAVYACDRGAIAPGARETFTFSVIKTTVGGPDDDLTFRADVVGEITRFDASLLTDPVPVSLPRTTPNLQLANNYSLDAIRSRVLGFNLTKSVWYCAESGGGEPAPSVSPVPPPATPADLDTQIGEDCNYHLESGGWFGFITPGYTLIAVEDIVVTDDLPDGQGFIHFDGSNPFNFDNTPNISFVGLNGGAGTTPLNETDISWNFNASGSGITIKDEFFRVDLKTRFLNDPVDASAAPNVHSAQSRNIARTSFNAFFQSDDIGGNPQPPLNIPVSELLNIPGYPLEVTRRVDMTVTEPSITVVKEVCNETLNSIGTGCGAFSTLVNNGDTNDSYIYRITLTNETSNSGTTRAPAFNVISTDTLDPTDLMLIADFSSDGLDNDGDGLIDALDPIGEGSISENVISNGTPAVITVSNTHSAPLLRVDPGTSVTFYYRVDPDDAIAPLQTMVNTVSMSYDTLDSDFGNQNVPQLDNTATAPNDAGRARIYTTVDALANVQMIPLLAQPKAIIGVSNSTLGGSPQEVVAGEEIRYQLTAQLPVANLRQFRIRDELPAGVRCIEQPPINLTTDAAYSGAGFDPGGPPQSTTCTSTGTNDFVEWNFGDQELTMAAATRFDFVIDFVARIENTAVTNEGAVLTNGGGTVNAATCTGGVGVCYVNEGGTAVALEFAPISVVVREPVLALTKSFAVANSDAGDVLTVTVTATNNGTAAAYNLRVLDDLLGSDLTYIAGSVSGTDPPDNVDIVTLGANQPIFSWNIANADYEVLPAAIKMFTFDVRVDTTAQPLEILDNTIQAEWSSLPDLNTALNSTGIIGADGTALGLRNGVLPNAAGAINDYETTASDSTSVLPLTITKTDLDLTVVPTIGAHKNFQIEISLPEGTTNNLVATDNLNFSGLSYFLSHNATYDVTYEFVGITSINAAAPDESAFNAFPAADAQGNVVWDIGAVITDEEDDAAVNAINPIIRINYFARLNNDLVTDVGDTLQNSVTVNYANGETPATIEVLTAATPIETVVESLLTVTKTVTNQTNPGVSPDGGDVLEYQITVSNVGDSTAFDINVVDTLPTHLLFDASFTPTAEINSVAVIGFVATPSAAPAGPLVWGRSSADNSLDLPATADNLVLTYRTIVQAITEPNTDISNSVQLDWTSLNDSDLSNLFERTGDGCPAITAPNDYCTAPVVSTITTIDSNSIVKSIIFDTYNVAGLSTAVDAIARVGDTVTYRLAVNIQEGTTDNVNVLDTLPVGMTFVDVVSINGDTTADYDSPASGVGSNFSYATIPAASVPVAGATLALNWNLGSITNDAAGDTSTDTLVIEYRARVTEDAGIAQLSTVTLSNTADLTYIDGNGAASPSVPRLTSTVDLTVLQPIMDALTKTDRSGRISGNTINIATDVMNFRLHSCNTTGLAPAYGVLITDTLPTQLNETTLAGPTNGALAPDVFINGSLATAGAANDYVYTPPAGRGGNMAFFFNTPINPGECVDIDFDIAFNTDFAANQAWSNTVNLNEYYSLPPTNAQLYAPIGPVLFNMNNNGTVFPPPEKTMTQPTPALSEATIGDEIIYQIRVPETAVNAVMYDVTVTDTLDGSLLYLSASDISANGFAVTDNTVLPGAVNLVIDQIPAGQQAIIELRARVDNNVNANAGDSFPNIANYTFANAPGGVANNGGSDTTASTLTIIEPQVAVAKTVANLTSPGVAPDAGDVLQYTITLTASGGVTPGDNFSDAFDISLEDTLSLGLIYNANLSVDGLGNTINPPLIVGDGITATQSLNWSLSDVNADIDVVEGSVVTVSYEVLVLDSVQANQDLINAVNVQWHSRDGPDANQRDGSAAPAHNDYFNVLPAAALQVTPDNNVVTKTRLSDTFNAADDIVRIGDIVDYELRINLQEGTHSNTVIIDNLPQGLAFEEIVSINGDTAAPYSSILPFTHNDIAVPVVTGDPITGPSSITWTVGDIVNAGDNLVNDEFVMVYRARVLNLVHPQLNNIALTNTVTFDYTTATGPAVTRTDNQLIDVQQPNLSITKVAAPANGDSVIDAAEIVTYTVAITNNGTATAYDTELLDTIPVGLRSPTVTMVSTQLLVAGTVLPNIAPVYNAAAGTANWNFDTGVADQYNIPAGDTLQIVYQLQADAGLGAGLTLTNRAQVQLYYSFDNDAVPAIGLATGVREIYVPVDFAETTLTTTLPNALLKENPADLAVSIGETFTYRITIPDVPQTTALYDVSILDNLTASAADLQFVGVAKVSGSQSWTPANVGTVADDLIITDSVNGVDIPANEQAVIDVTVILRNTDPPNIDTLTFTNTATYTFNQIDNNPTTLSNGLGSTTTVMTVVEPNLILDKRGPAGTVNFAAPISYTLVAENIGTGPAFDTTLIDQLPNVPDNPPLTGGTCDSAPINFDARITTTADEATVLRALVEDTDYTATHTAAPTCELLITTLTDAARVEAGEKLIVSYDASLNPTSQSGAALTNIAAVTEWFSLDTAGTGATGEIRRYIRTITDGTPTITDFEDAFTVIVDAPVISVQKTVVNLSTGQSPGADASPGDTLRYSIAVNNGGVVDAVGVTLNDVVPLNTTYVADSVTLNGLPSALPDTGVLPLIAGIDISSADLTPPLPTVGNGTVSAGQSAVITFDVILDAVITSGTVIENQAFVNSSVTGTLPSDDPNVNGIDDPQVIGDEDLTVTLITSAPAFIVEKTSQDLTGDPAILRAGDILSYTLTVKNNGSEDSVNSLLSDQVPVNTTYLANSTSLNGSAVADPSAGVSALQVGVLINALENTTNGFMRADADVAANNVATITFSVVVDLSATDGTVISNQGFVIGDGVGSGAFPQQPSDDPNTIAVNDPTINVVGNIALFDVQKTVAIVVDGGTAGIVDPNDVLRYTITATNFGSLPITNAVLIDAVPTFTQYVGNSTSLNGLAVSDPAANVSSLVAGINISSSDLPGAGILSPGQAAVIVFDVVIDAGTATGTVISNQGFVSNNELPTEPTDVDGIDSNGDQPTEVVVGSAPLISITKEVSVVGGGIAQVGSELEYIVRVTNTGVVPVTNVVITDDFDLPIAAQMTYVANSGLLNGSPVGVSFAGSLLTADYSTNYGDLPASGVAELRFRVTLASGLNVGDTVTNVGEVSWNVPTSTASAQVSIDVGGLPPGSANLNGEVWHDTNFNDAVDVGENLLQGWTVELYSSNVLLGSVLTNTSGAFQFSGLSPSAPAPLYELRYVAPGAVSTTASLGQASSIFTNAPQRITSIDAPSGANVLALNLPIQPNGVVYDALVRTPVAGTRLTMVNQSRGNQAVPASCFDDAVQADQVTLSQGFYKFDLNFSDGLRCAQGDEYEIQIQPPSNGYIGSTSLIVPPVAAVTGAPQDVINCPGTGADRVPATVNHCENSVSAAQPVSAAGDNYYLKFEFSGAAVRNQIFNNHIPVDPDLGGAVAISKVSGLQNVTRSQLVPYTITITNTFSVPLDNLNVIDNFPAGFKYVTGSSRVDSVEVEPVVNGRQLSWNNQSLAVGEKREFKLLLVVSSGVGEGEYINTAQMINTVTNTPASGVASATVRVIPDPTFDCTDIIGKVFDDKNMNAYQDEGELGLPGVQVATAKGLRITTDQHGRFHITCAVVPNEVRGSNFIMKLDDRSLPSGYRITTENPRVQRATRGKMMKFNFGAAIHRVVRLDLADGVFEKDSTELRPQWKSRIETLIIELQKDASILRLSYLGENESESEVDDRLDAIEEIISDRWAELDCCYRLMIETEVFWRKGKPSERKEFE